jgi:hypothetical protein
VARDLRLVTETTVDCATFEDLLHGVARVDVLQVDVEGFDAEVIRLFDFDRWQPSIVQFEHKHLSRGDIDSSLEQLAGFGYRMHRGPTVLAYRPGPARGAGARASYVAGGG